MNRHLSFCGCIFQGLAVVLSFFIAPGAFCKNPSGKNVDPVVSQRDIYENNLISRVLKSRGLVLDPDPDGKIIERLEVVRLPIVEPSDPWPNLVNYFHVVTQEHIVRQELLFAAGQKYDEEKIRESARNLRAMPLLFSTVRIVAARGKSPGSTVVLVITKDLWSIRLNSNGNFGGGQFNWFYVTPSEQNLLGYNQQLSLHYYMDRDVEAIGQIYQVPRLLGTRLALSQMAAVRINHHSGDMEGGWASVSLQRPLFSIDTKWAYWAGISFDSGIDRFYQGTDYRRVVVDYGDTSYSLPQIYKHTNFNLSAGVARSFGHKYKTNLSAGYNLRSRKYELTQSYDLLPPDVKKAYEQAAVPVQDQAGSLSAGVYFYEARYIRLHNIQTLGLTEDFRLGPSVSLEASWANPAFGFAQHSLRLDLNLGYRIDILGDLLSVSMSAGARYMPSHGMEAVSTSWIDQVYQVELENVSQSLWGIGRLLVRLKYAYSQYSRTRTLYTLGGDSTLRGFATGFTSGQRLLNINLEFRTRPWVIHTMHLGLVAFYDGGDAYGFSAGEDFHYHQAVGIGIRWLFPQFDKGTLRIDLGIPMGADFQPHVLDWVTVAFLQAF